MTSGSHRRAADRRTVLGILAGAFAAATLAATTLAAQAQTYPSRPVRIIVPFGAGGVADITSRIVAEKLSEKLGQRFIIENQAGAGGVTAARTVTNSPADGYTLGLLTNGTAVSVSLFKSLPFDPMKDFVAISTLGTFDFVIARNPAASFATVTDIVKLAREKPDTLNFGTVVIGSTQNLSAQMFKSMAGVTFAIVPYRNTPDLIVGLMREDVQLMIDSYAAMKSALGDRKIVAVATSGPARSPFLPDVPTVQEAGLAGFEATSWNALFAPAGTPPDVVAALNKALREVLALDDVKKRMLDLGIVAAPSTPAELTARLAADITKWARVIERAGIPKQ